MARWATRYVGLEILAVVKGLLRKGRFWEIVTVIGIVGALVAALVPAVLAARRAALRSQRMNDFKQIGLALHNLHDVYKHFPPAVRTDDAGRPLCSWRWQILPFLQAWMLGIDFGDRWDDPTNRWLTARPFGVYCFSRGKDFPNSLNTNVVAVTGPGTVFEEGRQYGLADIDSDTILAIEVAESGVHWAEPGDLRVDDLPESFPGGVDDDGFFVLFADGSVVFLRAEVPVEDLTKFFTIEGAKQYDAAQVLGPYTAMEHHWN